MRVVIQRVKEANCVINSELISQIGKGYLLLVGFSNEDNLEDIDYLVKKIVNLRIFSDESDKMNLSIKDVFGEILSISQFTLYGDLKKGNRPSFTKSLEPIKAKEYYLIFNNKLRENNLVVHEGVFGENMQISLVNDGPVTIILDSKELRC